MRTIRHIVIHCTATPQNATVENIQRYWRRNLGWKSPGYHYLIEANGLVHNLQPIELPSNGVAGHNATSIHISYIGGVNGKKAVDNRTPKQIEAMIRLVREMKYKFPKAMIIGHRDFKGVNKACPSFDVAQWLKSVGL
jgi:N-acetylmuramoyl-L-alanine amidase